MKSAIIIVGGVVAALAAGVAAMGPELRRYLKIRSM
jgi:hypothetical protein